MISLLHLKDFDELVALSEKCAGPAFSWNRLTLEAEVENGHIYTLKQGGAIVAFAIIRHAGDVREISAIATDPNCRRRGLASRLLSWLVEDRYRTHEVWLEVHEANLGARNLYRKLGFYEVGLRRRYYSDGGSAILLSRVSAV